MKILLADDDTTSRTLLARMLQLDARHDLVETKNGEEAWAALVSPGAHFDLGIFDVNMPVLDGIGLVERIRATPKLRPMALILCTAQNDRGTVEHACLLSVDHFIVKPFSRTVVAEKLKLVAARHSSLAGVDSFATVAERLGIDEPTVVELTRSLSGETRLLLAAARKESTPEAFRKLAVVANGLKGAALNLGLRALSVELDRAENALTKFGDPVRAQFPPSNREVALEIEAAEIELTKLEARLPASV